MKSIMPLLTSVVLLAACAGGADVTDDGEFTIVATIGILADVAANVAGDDAVVHALIPLGADPHDYQPSSQQMAAMAEADLVVAVGLGLEEGLHDVLEAAEADGVRVLDIGPEVDPIPFGDAVGCDPYAEAGPAEGDDHEHGSCDPHVWMDPLRMAEAARLIGRSLADLEPAVDWAARAKTYAAELEMADQDIVEILAAVPEDRRVLVTNHDSLGYFADRYGFEILATVIPGGSTLARPTSAELAALVETIRSAGVDVIFAETIEPSDLAESVAAEVGTDVAVVELLSGSLGAPGTAADTLIGMLVENAGLIAASLGE